MDTVPCSSTDKPFQQKPFQPFVHTPSQSNVYNRIPNFSQHTALPRLRGLFADHLISSQAKISRKEHDRAFSKLGLKSNSMGAAAA